MAVGVVDRVQVTIFPVISGRTGTSLMLRGAGDFDLELLGDPDARRCSAAGASSKNRNTGWPLTT
jgi:hypothetical protein